MVDLEELNSSKINLPDPEKLEEEERDFLEEQRRDKRKMNSAGSSGSPGMVSRRDDTAFPGKMSAPRDASPLRNHLVQEEEKQERSSSRESSSSSVKFMHMPP